MRVAFMGNPNFAISSLEIILQKSRHHVLAVISNPPIKHDNIYDIHSSKSLPSGVCPMLVLGSENAYLAGLKMLVNISEEVRDFVINYHDNNVNKLRIEDIKEKHLK